MVDRGILRIGPGNSNAMVQAALHENDDQLPPGSALPSGACVFVGAGGEG